MYEKNVNSNAFIQCMVCHHGHVLMNGGGKGDIIQIHYQSDDKNKITEGKQTE